MTSRCGEPPARSSARPAPGRSRRRRVALGADALANPLAAGAAVPERRPPPPSRSRASTRRGSSHRSQDRLLFASFDVVSDDRDDLVRLLQDWTRASRKMVLGQQIGRTDNDDVDAPPDDTGEAVGLGPSSLTLTFGFGASLFDRPATRSASRRGSRRRWRRCRAFARRRDRARDQRRRPRDPGLCRRPARSCFHAIRNLARIGRGVVALRWSQTGVRPHVASPTRSRSPPRNLMGFKDGTNNILVAEDTAALDDARVGRSPGRPRVDAGRELPRHAPDPHAARDLGPLDARRPGADHRARQGEGAPLGSQARARHRRTSRRRADGELVIPDDAHIRLAAPAENRRRPVAPPGLLVHRRHRPGDQPARRRAVLHRVPARPAHRVHPGAAQPRAPTRSTSTSATTRPPRSPVPPGVGSAGYVGETLFS